MEATRSKVPPGLLLGKNNHLFVSEMLGRATPHVIDPLDFIKIIAAFDSGMGSEHRPRPNNQQR